MKELTLETTQTLCFFIIPDRVNIRGLHKLMHQVFYQLNYRMCIILVKFCMHEIIVLFIRNEVKIKILFENCKIQK